MAVEVGDMQPVDVSVVGQPGEQVARGICLVEAEPRVVVELRLCGQYVVGMDVHHNVYLHALLRYLLQCFVFRQVEGRLGAEVFVQILLARVVVGVVEEDGMLSRCRGGAAPDAVE